VRTKISTSLGSCEETHFSCLATASLFEQIDSNHDGEVDWEELKQHGMVLQRLPEELGELTGDSGKCVAGGKMSRHDFDSFITTSLEAAFQCFDKNNSGVLEQNEQLVIYQLFGECHTQFEPQPPMSKQQFVQKILEIGSTLGWAAFQNGFLKILEQAHYAAAFLVADEPATAATTVASRYFSHLTTPARHRMYPYRHEVMAAQTVPLAASVPARSANLQSWMA